MRLYIVFACLLAACNQGPTEPVVREASAADEAALEQRRQEMWYGKAPANQPTPPPASTAEQPRLSMAAVIAQHFVKKKLKSPDEADFEFGYRGRVIGDGRYIVEGKVKAPNSYGQMLEQTYVTRLRYTGGDAADPTNWQLTDFAIN